MKENVTEEQGESLTSDGGNSDNESLDTQVTSNYFKLRIHYIFNIL